MPKKFDIHHYYSTLGEKCNAVLHVMHYIFEANVLQFSVMQYIFQSVLQLVMHYILPAKSNTLIHINMLNNSLGSSGSVHFFDLTTGSSTLLCYITFIILARISLFDCVFS